MPGQSGFWDFEQRLEELSREGDPLEKLAATVDFEMFRPILLRALRRGRARVDEDGREREGLLIPAFGYKACPGEPCQHRPPPWHHPADEGDGCGGA